jgi:hypothetical protein
MRIAIHQPHYLPWLGYVAKWAAADLLVLLDTVQYEKNGFQNRNRVKTRGGARWLTVPVQARLGMAIHDVPIADADRWARRHFTTIAHAYAQAPHFGRVRDALRELYETRWTDLRSVALASMRVIARGLGIRTPVRLASELGVTAGDPTRRLVELCRAVGGTTYLAGRDATKYLDRTAFRDAGIDVVQQRYEHPEYAQLHGSFVPFLSALDILLVHGDDALRIIRAADSWDGACVPVTEDRHGSAGRGPSRPPARLS